MAEYLAVVVDSVYNTYTERTGFQLMIATIFFAFQIYCDFGSYSNIAIGAAKVMGFRLMENFNTPYFGIFLFPRGSGIICMFHSEETAGAGYGNGLI